VALDFDAELATHRPALLRHCYRMLGSFAEAEDLTQDTFERALRGRDGFRGDAPLRRWLYSIATHACLNRLAQRKRRALPTLERGPAGDDYRLEPGELDEWITPAADAALFPGPAEALERRESVALAYVALVQRLPPRQRAALLLKDVVGFSAEEIAEALELTVPAVNSAVHRGREAVERAEPRADEPSAAALAAFVRAWETRDLDAMVALLREDVVLCMPPYPIWFQGAERVARFFATPRFAAFWSSVGRITVTRANGLPALAFERRADDGRLVHHALMPTRFVDGLVAEMTPFIGPSYFAGFELSSP
jgi:RNA polymerase sigma-70 factor (ECF subfamily)